MITLPLNPCTLNDMSISNSIDGCNLPTQSIVDAIWAHAVASPESIAASDEEKSISYRQLCESAAAVATYLQKNSTFKEALGTEVIAVCMPRSVDYLTTILGAWAAGLAVLPLDPQLPAERLRGMLDAAHVDRIIADGPTTDFDFDAREVVSYSIASSHSAAGHFHPARLGHLDLAYILFTSGSTGVPKGALVEHGGMINNILNKIQDFGIGSTSVVAQNASQSFDVSIWQAFAGLFAGGRTLFISDDTVSHPLKFLQRVSDGQVDVLEVVPTYLSLLNETLENSYENVMLPKLRFMILTGEAIGVANIQKFRSNFPHVAIANAYGPTEASDDITHYVMPPSESIPSIVPLGKALSNFAIFICDNEMKPVPVGEIGEIVVVGLGVCRGYCNPPLGIPSPFFLAKISDDTCVRGYQTGDLGTMDNRGLVYFRGRKDRQTKINGMRVELTEIEYWLERAPGVSRAVVINSVQGPSGASLTAFIAATAQTTTARVLEFLRPRLPSHMLPKQFYIVDSFPVLPSGKIDFKELQKKMSSTEGSLSQEVHFDDPEEDRFWRIVCDVLGRPHLDPNSDFVSSGGDSFKAIRVAALFGPEAEVNDLFSDRPLKEVARITASRRNKISDPVSILHMPISPVGCVLCVPNSGGDPIGFRNLVESINSIDPNIAILGVKLVRGSIDELNLNLIGERVRAVIDFLDTKFDLPTIVYGQCNGSAMAVAIVRGLEAMGRGDILLLVGSALMRTEVTPPDHRSDEEILEFLGGLGADLPNNYGDKVFFLEDFRYDVAVAAVYYNHMLSESNFSVESDIACMLGEIDPMLSETTAGSESWEMIGNLYETKIIANAGHFLHRDAPNKVAAIIASSIARLTDV